VHFPYREVSAVEISFYYNVLSGSDLYDQVFLFVRFAGYSQELHVFENGDTVGSWLKATVTVPTDTINGISLPDSLLLEVGMATDLSGIQSNARDAYVYVDDITVTADVRPFPEQIGLKANGTQVVGWTPGSIYPYEPDEDNRDAWDDGGSLDLNGIPYTSGDADPTVSVYGSGWSSAAAYQTGIQFPIAIPQGAVITNAYLEVEPLSSSTTGYNDLRLYVSGSASGGGAVSAFTSGSPSLEARYDWVDTSIDWIIGADWLSDVRIRQKSPDLAPLIQSIVSDSNWASNNYIVVMLDYMYSTSYQSGVGMKGAYGTRFSADELPRLFVEYKVPLVEDVVYLFSNEKDITIDHTLVVDDLTDFPVMVDIYDADLRTDVQADGDDISFKTGDMPVDFEIELFDQDYNSSHAHLVAWVKVPSLSSTTDTIITMMYGNPEAPPMSSTSVWDEFEVVHHMNEDPSGTVYDSTSNNHHGTSYGTQGSEDAVSGQIDGAIDFDNETQDVIGIGQIYTDDWTGFTMSAWIREDESRDCRVFSKSETTTPSQHIITMRISGTTPTFRIWTDGTGGLGNSYDATGYSVNLGQWHYLVWRWSAIDERIYAYLDGNMILNVTHDGDTIYDSVEVFTLGNTDLTNSRYFDGVIDEARLTQSVRAQSWISTEYNNMNDPSTFYSVGSESTTTETFDDQTTPSLIFTTSSENPVDLMVGMDMQIEGSGQTLDENLEDGTSYFVANGSEFVNWTARVLVSPPNTTTAMNALVDYPLTQWGPTAVLNPLGQSKTYGTDWAYDGGTLTIYSSALDVWGVWTIKFISWNYVEDLRLGVSGQPLADTATLNINDALKVRATTPWVQNARAGLILTDPSGSVWHTTYNTTGSPGTPWHVPSFQFRKPLTIPSSQVDSDLVNFPVMMSYADSTLQDTSRVQEDGDDIVFVQNGVVLSHEIERFTQSTGRIVAWVKANLSSTVDNSLYMYYGNPYVGSCESTTDVWSNDYEAVWHLAEVVSDEGTGGIHYDSTTNDYQGTQNGNGVTSGISNSYGQAFDGTDDWISVSASEGLDPVGDTTLSGWFYISNSFSSTSTTSMMIMSKYLDDDNNFHVALVGTDYTESGVSAGSLAVGFEIDSDEFTKWTTKTVWSIGWYHYTVVIDADAVTNTKIYIDGSDVTNTGTAGSGGTPNPADLDFSADWGIGGRYAETSEFPTGEAFLTGEMDEVRISTTLRPSGWISTERNNQLNPTTFVQRGSEQQQTSPEHTFTKTMDSSAIAGEWTASVYYNDTGTSVSEATGLYERNFIVKHDSSLTLISPADAVSDKLSLSVAGNLLQIEVELTDDITTNGVTGATVKINWSVADVP
ncbi:DUF2341 domain-containing protein, partial [Candidatus Thorarchaeota archaeon]